MNPFVRIETWCANAVERAFALAFPSALEPVQIARRLIATFEGAEGAADSPAVGGYVVRISPADAARLEVERGPLEAQWSRLLGALRLRGGRPAEPPPVELRGDASLPIGTIAIDAEPMTPETLVASASWPVFGLRIVRGMPVGAYYPLPNDGRGVVIGRDPSCELVLGDPRISRRHLRLSRAADGAVFEDLGSANGTQLNGAPVKSGSIVVGDRLNIGDSIVVLEQPT